MEKLGNITLHNADCMDLLRSMPDNAYDLAIVDPPYGLRRDGQREILCKVSNKARTRHRKQHEFKGWDSKIPPPDYFTELRRVSKNQIIWGGNYFVQNLKPSMGWIVWDKGQHGLTMSDCELAYSSFNRATRVVVINRIDLLHQDTIHPTEKPIRLYKWLLMNYAKPCDKILDTHLGSGSIGIACHDLGYELTGIELDAEYYAKAVQRIKSHQLQQKLF